MIVTMATESALRVCTSHCCAHRGVLHIPKVLLRETCNGAKQHYVEVASAPIPSHPCAIVKRGD